MIQYSVEFTAAAKEDYDNLCGYEIKHPAISSEQVRIAITSLELMPERFPFFEEKFTVSKQIRIMKEKNICIFYYINKEEKVVSIIRMMCIQDVAVTQQLVTK